MNLTMHPRLGMIFLVLVTSVVAATPAGATQTESISYQGYLTDEDGAPIDGIIEVTFALYYVESGGSPVWMQTKMVQAELGLFSTVLGDVGNPLSPAVFSNPAWLGIAVEADAEMEPRRPITPTPVALVSVDSEALEGQSAASLDQSAHVLDLNNPHGVNIGQIGAASQAQVSALDTVVGNLGLDLNGTALELADTGGNTIADLSMLDQSAHVPDVDNPHVVTVEQLGAASASDLAALTTTVANLDLLVNDQSALITTLQDQVAFLASKVSTTVFVSSVAYPAGFGSLAGADAECQNLADTAGLSGTYIAWLSDDTGSPSNRFVQSPSAYKMVDGTVVANNWADLIDGELITRINLDENSVARSSRVFTGTLIDGTPAGTDCANWTDETSDGRVMVGSTFEGVGTNENWWTRRGAVGCQDSYRLYCFEQ